MRLREHALAFQVDDDFLDLVGLFEVRVFVVKFEVVLPLVPDVFDEG